MCRERSSAFLRRTFEPFFTKKRDEVHLSVAGGTSSSLLAVPYSVYAIGGAASAALASCPGEAAPFSFFFP